MAMRRLGGCAGLAVALCLGAAPGAWAQPFSTGESVFSLGVGTLLATLDQEVLFDTSDFGLRVAETLADASQRLNAENRQIEATLTSEEAALTELRGTLPPDEFRALADEFDTRVEGLRRQQEARARALGIWRDLEQQRFFEAALPVLTQLLRDTGAVAIIDSRAILLALEEADLTAQAVVRMNAAIGDGAEDALPVFSPETLPEPPGMEQAPRPDPADRQPGAAAGQDDAPPLSLPTQPLP
jgi:Skp family chaperone for outer membrane proteins